ncbi:MAG: DUF512 domain-containing protein, partial [Anaerofustis stercorihominis]|nr:DUF512 domain-containing protein [Anaerofustis stercorihominis]
EEIDSIGKIDAALITGELGRRALKEMAQLLKEKDPNVNLSVITVKNNYFGGKVTASGLVCGCDIIDELNKNEDNFTHYIMPSNMLNDGMLTLDNYSLEDLREKTNKNIICSPFWAEGFLDTLIMIGGENE